LALSGARTHSGESATIVGAITAVAYRALRLFHPLIGLLLAGIAAMSVVEADDRREGWSQALFGACVALFATVMSSVYLVPTRLEQSLVRFGEPSDGFANRLQNIW
jgi:hypothetical protein